MSTNLAVGRSGNGGSDSREVVATTARTRCCGSGNRDVVRWQQHGGRRSGTQAAAVIGGGHGATRD
ncbi:hypothetical protein DEO72_LG1g2243 [Vigna unguiculata]|uniref:Uncharacterized protein n=1 Tax=Vigna unguiculata TaxID=3917 RepID=A0A4D6KS94_VIGUN|nr:hypothetical protein DEO72_LG1g2243 [Vigna unguiculata]